jgi:hypothetical protein
LEATRGCTTQHRVDTTLGCRNPWLQQPLVRLLVAATGSGLWFATTNSNPPPNPTQPKAQMFLTWPRARLVESGCSRGEFQRAFRSRGEFQRALHLPSDPPPLWLWLQQGPSGTGLAASTPHGAWRGWRVRRRIFHARAFAPPPSPPSPLPGWLELGRSPSHGLLASAITVGYWQR